ncbi:hypothetical protein GPECTOR_7g1085 [Gonium pectorale]|uniref:Uncharacterized protein n=1 Tax=Gonium pectorale TaxID=33097 RepID=A0A150GTY3_GONPE|nr:hypothetical protein GPECTOR_7g1085 [Gonium pectorale]|eukprot:KXZ53192.1 hypothetical protein GPECTOR_7g1085 [Gonium pectorale]
MLISSSNMAFAFACIEQGYGDEISELQAFQNRTTFYAKYRDHVSSFEDRAFVKFELIVPDNLTPGMALKVGTKLGVLSTLGTLATMEKEKDKNPDAAAFVKSNGWLRDSWRTAVTAAGLRWDYYEKVRAFKGASNESFHDAEPAEEALLMLEKTPVPDDMVKYKEALIALLEVLAGK